MINFRWTYDFDYGPDASEHPIIEVQYYKLQDKDLSDISSQLQRILKPEVLDKAEIRIKKK